MCTTRGLAGGFPEHWEGENSLGELGEVAEDVGIRPDSCKKVLPSGASCGASFGGGNMGLDGNDAAKNGGGTRGFIDAGGGDVGT